VDRPAPSPNHPSMRRRARGIPAANVLVVLLVCLLAWTVLYAPELLRNARTHEDGIRRDVAVALLSPIAWIADTTGLGAITDAAARAAGRDPDAQVGGVVGGVEVTVDDLPTFHPRPSSVGPTVAPPPPVRNTPLREPTSESKLRTVVVGDSLAAGIGFYAERVFRPFWVDVVKQGRISTGLARPDYFDWPGQMQVIVNQNRPELTIVMLGENDNQDMQGAAGEVVQDIGQAGWPDAYERRVEEFARIATSRKGHVVWVGLPITRDEGRWALTQRLNAIYEDVAARLPNVVYVDTWSIFSKDGQYTAYYKDKGKVRLIRESDGIHFTADGYTLLMEQVAKAAREEFRLDPKTYET
jgi:lysophospholipase L1-like esterase